MSSQTVETWRVMTPEGIFEADLDTLRQWIVEGCVLPTDKVAKGNLNWIDAGRAPSLRKAFAGEMDAPQAAPTPPQFETVAAGVVQPSWPEAVTHESSYNNSHAADAQHAYADEQNFYADASYADANSAYADAPQGYAYNAATLHQHTTCYNHMDAPPHYICRACNNTFCKSCPNFVNKIPLCPLCGDLCNPFNEVKERAVRREYQSAGFGFAEFGKSLAYPFKNIFSLIAMSIFYAFLLFGGFKGQLVAWGILFGCMSHVISQFAWGRTNRGFLPEMDSFSFYEDVVRPLFLSIGIFIITLGPMIVLILAVWFGFFSGSSKAPITPSPMSPAQMQPAPAAAAEKSEEFTDEDMDALIEGNDPEKEAAAAKKVDRMHPAYQMNKEMERQKEPDIPLSSLLGFLGVGGAIIGLFLLALAWAFFYYPMALAVAGYTEDFWSVVNPVVGLDTMRRMGFTYVKAFMMYLSVQIVGIGLSIVVSIILAPFDMPFFGNLPARFIDGIITFYTSLVVACILGFALYKCADKLGIETE
jgi:hypothetical protein